ncbi:MAG TPA: LD-carboxypeptidase [Vicinamibacterales bacterium]|jgi:muramoyltetrapeptide carboxypeptidase|nr:LD-carboxypeptidase [Vicinamibacterales bacterium]
MRKPPALRPGDRIAVVAPASPFARDEFDAGIAEIRRLGFEPVFDESVFERTGYVAGSPEIRARAWQRAWDDPSIAALVAARGGYGSAQLLPRLDAAAVSRTSKAFIGYSDNTSILAWLTTRCALVSFHGPMLERRLAKGASGYDRDTFERCLCRTEPVGEISHPQLESLKPGEAAGMLVGGTLTQLTASLGTPYAFDPPAGSVFFFDEVGERPYRIDRMLTQLRLSGLLARASAIVFGELPNCDEPGGSPAARAAVRDVLTDFPGPILYGLPSGHTTGATLTLPFGVRSRVVSGPRPVLVIEEAAVT